MDSLEQLRGDLWSRWRRAFERANEFSQSRQPSGRIVYAKVPLFDVKKYSPRKFQPGGRMLREMPQNVSSYYAYSLDEQGRPTHMLCRHIVNRFDWRGRYFYSSDEVEYIEICLQTVVVSEYTRIVLRDGLSSALQHLRVNGGGSHLGNRTGKQAAKYIAQDIRNYLLHVEEYASSNGRIVSGKALMDGWGLPERRSVLDYSYSDAGQLERIVRTFVDGSRITDYAARTTSTLRDLSARLSEMIASRVIEALKETAFDSPLLSVELFYRSVTNYVPYVTAITQGEFNANPAPVPMIDHRSGISLNDEEFEPEMAEFLERLKSAEQWDTGTRMLRQAALTITRQAAELLKTADCFVAFAIDWEFEGQELQSILKQCGASAATLKELKRIGWLD